MTPESDIPKAMRLTMVFIDRVGFPTMAFLLMSYMCFVSLNRITEVLSEVSLAIQGLAVQVQELRKDK